MVDAANVIGSVPDGWWRDRAGAVRRLRDALVSVARGTGSQRLPESLRGIPVEVVLVVEGAARNVESIEDVHVVAAPRSGDDAIVDVVAAKAQGRACVVATADRALSARVRALGARVIGPRTVHPKAG